MGSQEEYKAGRREHTREAAAALVDDLCFFRTILAKEAPTAGDLRRLSAQLRRILVDGTIEKIAGPRVGAIKLNAPIIGEVVKLNRAEPYVYLGVGTVKMFGVAVSLAAIERAAQARPVPGFDPDARQLLSLTDFMKQGVMVFEGQWLSRRAILRYMANVAEGVHSGEVKDDEERVIRRSRHMSKMSLENGMPILSMNLAAVSVIELPPILSRSDIDGALVELWAAADLLTSSPDVIGLEAYVDANG